MIDKIYTVSDVVSMLNEIGISTDNKGFYANIDKYLSWLDLELMPREKNEKYYFKKRDV